MSWATDLKKITDTGKVNLEDLSVKVKADVFSMAMKRTHVQDGFLRGNWQISEGSPATGTLDRADKSAEGTISSSAESEIQAGSTPDGMTYYVNNLPYAKTREDEDAMVGGAVAAVQKIVSTVARNIR